MEILQACRMSVLARFARSLYSRAPILQPKFNTAISQQYLVSIGRFGRVSPPATYATSTELSPGPKKKRKSRKSKAKGDADTTSDEPQKKKRKKRKSALSDEEIKETLIGPFIPFEGGTSGDSVFQSGEISVEKEDTPEGRFYCYETSTNTYSFPSVTTVLDKTGSSYPLLLWKRKLTDEHGKEGFEAIRRSTLKSGSDFHKELENRLLLARSKGKSPRNEQMASTADNVVTFHAPPKKGSQSSVILEGPKENTEDLPLPPQYMQSVEHVLDDIGEVKALETSIVHLPLGYVGTFDCLAEYKGTLCLIDWKTSGKLKSSLADCYDYPLQVVAYAGAVNHDPRRDYKALNVLIVIAYADGTPAHAHFINHTLCQKYWLRWLLRLQDYQTQFSEDLSELII